MNKQKVIHATKPETVRKGWASKQCHCGAWFSLPQSHANRHRSCSAECGRRITDERKQLGRSSRERKCAECGAMFVPRATQLREDVGRYCSQGCGSKAFCRTDAAKQRTQRIHETLADRRARGLIAKQVQPRGAESPYWKGGRKASYARRVPKNRLWRQANPEKVREFSQRRSQRKTGRLPRGTVATLLKKQRGLCAFCARSLADGYHLDHIIPLALGGAHEPLNVQLLCPTCNVRKSAKHPIRFAQEHGRLL
jgi:5-methylcytosine-specific restriction endonuclease McrA